MTPERHETNGAPLTVASARSARLRLAIWQRSRGRGAHGLRLLVAIAGALGLGLATPAALAAPARGIGTASLPSAFGPLGTLAPTPTVTGVEPNDGPAAGGTAVTITGTNFIEVSAVKFGSTNATSFKVESASKIVAVAPAGTGSVDVTVTSAGGTSPTGASDLFDYAPTVTHVEPNFGATTGGTLVTITGTNFNEVSAVKFGSNTAARVKVKSPTSITATSPAGSSGTVDVTVTTAGGTSPTREADRFTYGPEVTAVSPRYGSPGGGTSVTITGSRFSGATAVKFGSANATSFTVGSATSITAVSPPGTGTVDVTVTTPEGTSATSFADHFDWGPTITKLQPNTGANAGGTSVNVIGTNFNEVQGVEFGSSPATSFTRTSESSITAVSPPFTSGSASVPVTVTTRGGVSPSEITGTILPEFYFRYGPVVTSVSPKSGPAGTSVEILGKAFGSINPGDEFPNLSAVRFGSTNATSFAAHEPRFPGEEPFITAVAPAGTGIVDVTVETLAGTSPISSADHFTLTPAAPTVVTDSASSVTRTTAALNATVNPNGGNVGECKFEYGTTTSYGSSAACVPSPGSGESPVAVSASVGGLSAGTTYHFRISATNAIGTSKGEDESFTTSLPAGSPPTVTTTAATAVTRTLATLNGTVNPNATAVSDCHFDYGTTTSYGSTAPCASPPGSGESTVAVVASLGNLSPASTYHFRVSATNPGGTSTGSDQTFTTLAALPTPHWYKNGTKVALGEKSNLIGWGTLTLESSAGTATCRTAQAANLENTAGAARKETVLFAAWECKPVGGSCTGGEQRATPRHLPWQGTMLEEGVEGSGELREEGWGIELNLECFKGGVNTSNMLFKTGPVLAETGTFTPRWLNGTSAVKPAEASFDLSSGHLDAEVEKAEVPGTTKGKLKFVGYQDNAPTPLVTLAKP